VISEKARQCIEMLEEVYGKPTASKADPLDLLVMTILSQNTTEVNSLKAYSFLKSAYPDYEKVLISEELDLARLIRVGGLGDIKAQRIKEALHRIKQDSGSLDLGFLGNMNKEAAMDYLLALPGVGRKTASVVLLFGFGFPFMPVDTHVHRVSQRIGLAAEGASFEETQETLERTVPSLKYLSLHLNLIRHGRSICHARRPLCEECHLRTICDYYLGAQALNERKAHPRSALR
jgi:endonuclease-3